MSYYYLKYLTGALRMASATMVGSTLAGFCCVMMAVQLGCDPKAGLPVGILLGSLNMSLIYSVADNRQNDEKIPLACRIIGMVIGLSVPVCFWLLGVHSAYMTLK